MIAALIFSMMAVATTDQTVNVTKGTKLDVNNFAGDVNVKTWDKDAVRVEVTHSDRETVEIRQDDGVVHIRGRSTRGGPPRSLDYTITIVDWSRRPRPSFSAFSRSATAASYCASA